jgi:TPR repeat protein
MTEALRLFKLAAERASSAMQLGFFYGDGAWGWRRTTARLRASISSPRTMAALRQYDLGRLYQNSRGGLTQNDREAARLLGSPLIRATFAEGVSDFCDGARWVVKDDVKAVGYYKRAADQGNAGGRNNLSPSTRQPRWLAKDDRELRASISSPPTRATPRPEQLGRSYQFGRGGLPQSDQARDVGLAPSRPAFWQVNLAYFYETGRGGIPQDEVEAARLRLVAEQGGPARNKLATF